MSTRLGDTYLEPNLNFYIWLTTLKVIDAAVNNLRIFVRLKSSRNEKLCLYTICLTTWNSIANNKLLDYDVLTRSIQKRLKEGRTLRAKYQRI